MEFGDRICALACRATALVVFCADRNGKLVFVNRSTADLTGVPLDSLRTRNAADVLVDGWPAAAPSAGECSETLLLFRRADGREVPVFCSLVFLARDALTRGGCEPGADFECPLVFVVGHPEPRPPAHDPVSGDAPVSTEFSAQCRHTLLNAVSPVKTAANAFLDILRAWASEREGDAVQSIEIILELASALEMGADQLEQTILELFPRPPPEHPFGESWGAGTRDL
ncbi:MAG: hypothetical protein GXP31_11410 [Kiritimatiellaeota bacterium]|nr:hypothetical protein [Kiritimatiellota bacterium]